MVYNFFQKTTLFFGLIRTLVREIIVAFVCLIINDQLEVGKNHQMTYE